MRTLKHPSRLLITFAVAACASSGGGEGGPRRSANLITAEELTDAFEQSVYQAIQRLRPRWLTARGNASFSSAENRLPSVIMDDVPYRLSILDNVRPEEVETLRYISASDATTRWGTGYPAGVIEVRTRRR